ncbi:hypothetical protein SAMN05421504_102400 [Amycolatopsis xylanica]|uniref:Small secreted protein n=1 Tax=Amycolatopsis xylanica TaxID=589385 RepID=A0A1H2Z719_9PSEU|nr:hypothetical protein [Amycolatopsis xylanica]SDX13117.1 hypothetical protein SAMN05421504_102400 [Amycolatopsis xylanica]
MRRSLSLAGAGVALALALTACGSADKPSTAAPSPSSPAPAPASSSSAAPAGNAGAWVNDFCGSLTELANLDASKIQPPAETATIAEKQKAMSQLLETIGGAISPAVEKLSKLPASPVAAGDEAKKTFLDTLKPVDDQIKAAKAKLDAAPAGDAQAVAAAALAFQSVGTALSSFDPEKQIKGAPELEAAGKDQPNCKALDKK